MPNKQDEINKIKIDLISSGYEDVMKVIDNSQAIEDAITNLVDQAFAAGYECGKENQDNSQLVAKIIKLAREEYTPNPQVNAGIAKLVKKIRLLENK